MRARALLLVAFVLAGTGWAQAHEIGKTQVSAAFPGDGTYQVDIVVDPDALLTRLEVYGGSKVSTGHGLLGRTERDARVVALSAVFLDRVSLVFDGQPARPRFAYRPASAFGDLAQAPSIVRLTGPVPVGTRAVTLAYGLALGSFALNVRVAGVLRDLGLPRSQFLTALLTFNGGVEAGQLTVIALAFLAVAYWRSSATTYRRFIVQPASLAIAVTGLYWTIQRLS